MAAWPLTLQDTRTQELSRVLVWGGTKGLDIDLKRFVANGPFKIDSTIAVKDQTIGLHVDSQFTQRRLLLKSITGEGLGGNIEGYGFFDFDNLLKSEGEVHWNNVDAQSILTLVSSLNGLGGNYSGTLRFSPTDYATDRDATGPSHSAANSFQWRKLERTPAGQRLFHRSRRLQGRHQISQQSARAVVDRLDWDLAGGNLQGWSRVTWYDLEPFIQINLNLNDLSLDQIVKALCPPGQPHKPTPGKLSGPIMAAGNPFTERASNPHQATRKSA